MMGKRLAET
jgi:hypothetical protein